MDATGSPMCASLPTMGSSLNLGTSVGLKQGLKRQPSLAGFKEAWAQPIPPSYLPNGADYVFNSKVIKLNTQSAPSIKPLKKMSSTQLAHRWAKQFHIALEETNA
jgi:hypothetical protein